MTKRFLASVLAASMAITSLSTAPARADAGEIARFVVGAGAILLLGNAIARQNRENKNARVSRRYEDPQPRVTRRHVHPAPSETRRHVDPAPRNTRRMLVPSSCLRENYSDYGPRRYADERCLSRNMRDFSRLPDNCRTAIWTRKGRSAGYSASCLRRNGWTFS